MVINQYKSPLIMGILNVTPDSFSDGGRFVTPKQAVQQALMMIEEGADVIDIGAESSRPGALPISVQEELDRLMPVVELLKQHTPVRISIDTLKPEVMQATLGLGVWMINDINALLAPSAIEVVKQSQCQVCLMHKQGEPANMQKKPSYTHSVVETVLQFLLSRVDECERNGIEKRRLWIDPGFGFGKTLKHNLVLLQQIKRFTSADLPVMIGVSRKSMLGEVTRQAAHARVTAGVVAVIHALQQGVSMIRTHDIKATKEAILMWDAIKNA